jgi:hypothetical protein
MAAHHTEVNVKGFRNAVHPMQWMRLMMMMMMITTMTTMTKMKTTMMWNGSEEDGNVRS